MTGQEPATQGSTTATSNSLAPTKPVIDPPKSDREANNGVVEDKKSTAAAPTNPEECKPPPEPAKPMGFASALNSSTAEEVFGAQMQLASTIAHEVVGAQIHVGPATYNVRQKDTTASVSFEDDLQLITDCVDPEVAISPDDTNRYVEILREQRVVLVMHTPKNYREAISAMRSMRNRVRELEVARRHYTSAFDGLFPIHSFYATKADAWPSWLRNSLIFLDRSRDAAAYTYVQLPEKLTFLRDRLKDVDAQLVITVSTERLGASTHRAGQGLWFISAPDDDGAKLSHVSPTIKGHFESVVAMCAAFFPGLGVSEFGDLVDALAPPRTKSSLPARQDTSTKGPDSAAVSPPEPTREERWHSGEPDAVLAELGISFRVLSEAGTAENGLLQAGFAFTKDEHLATMPSFMLSNYPTLLQRSLETLTKLYLSATASPRFRIGYRNLLFRLDVLGIFPLTPDWLLSKLHAAGDGISMLELSRRCALLLVKAMDRKQGDELVRAVLRKMVDGALEYERQLLTAIPEDVLAAARDAAARTLAEDQEDPSEAFWSTIRELPAVQETANLLVALQVMITMARHLPSDVAASLNRLLSDDVIEGTSWQAIVGGSENQAQIARLPRFALRWVLTQVIEQEPSEWAAFSQVVPDESAAAEGDAQSSLTSSRSTYSRKHDLDSDAVLARRLATDCLRALTGAIVGLGTGAMPDGLYNALLSEHRRERTGQLLSKLITRARASEASFVVWLLREITAKMLGRRDAIPKGVSDAMFAIAAPLRTSLSPAQRLKISATAHDALNSYLARRNYFSTIHRREQAEVERGRVAIMHIVIRAISGASAPAAN